MVSRQRRFPDDYLFDQIHCEHNGGQSLDIMNGAESSYIADSADKDFVDSATSVQKMSE